MKITSAGNHEKNNLWCMQYGASQHQREHQVYYDGCGGLIMRHNSIWDLLQQELLNAVYKTEIESNAGSPDRCRPGVLNVLNWEKGNDLCIPCAIINPMTKKRQSHLIEGSVSAAADVEGKCRREKYADKIGDRTSIFLPLLLATQGWIRRDANEFIIEVERR